MTTVNHPFPVSFSYQDEKIIIRLATAADFPALFMLRCEENNINWTGSAGCPQRQKIEDRLSDQIKDPNEILLAADLGRCLISYAHVHIINETLVETAIAVSGSFSGRGLGRAIIKNIAKGMHLKNSGIRINAWIFPENQASVKAHEAAGYEFDSTPEPRPFRLPAIGKSYSQHCWVYKNS